MFWTKVVEKIKAHILCPITFSKKNLAAYKIMLKNTVKLEAINDGTILRICIARWISKATSPHVHAHSHESGKTHTHTHTDQYVILAAFPRQ
jgi:hypothetical protein